MRVLIQIVSVFFIVLGIVMVVGMLAPMISNPPPYTSFPATAGVIMALITPGGMMIIFGSVSYMLCSIDMRLEELVNRPPPKVTVAAPAQAQPATLARDHDLF